MKIRSSVSLIMLVVVMLACQDEPSTATKESKNHSVVQDTLISGVQLVKVPKGLYKSGINCATRQIAYDFWMGKYEITNAQYFLFLKRALAKGVIFCKKGNIYVQHPAAQGRCAYVVKYLDHAIYLNPNNKLCLRPQWAKHPVTSVTWYGANAFCAFYGFQLPNAAEWEKAARGNMSWRFPWGNTIDGQYANYFNSHDPYEPGTTPVGFFNGTRHGIFQTKKAVSPYGCYDMSGNAWEWTRTKFGSHTQNYLGKGGSYNLHTAAQLQIYFVSTFRVAQDLPPPDCTHLADGFRVVKINAHE